MAELGTTEIPEVADLRQLAIDAILARTSKLTEKSFSQGFIADLMVNSIAVTVEDGARIGLANHRRTYFRTSEDVDLDVLVEDHVGIERFEGVKARGEVRFSRPDTTPGTVRIEVGTRLETTEGTLFQTTEEVLLQGLQIDVNVEASTVGAVGNVDVDAIVVIRDALTDSTVTVTNLEEMAGGSDRETDPEFRARAREHFATLRRGTLPAVEFGALQVAGVVKATGSEETDPPTVYIADVTGGANTTLVAEVIEELKTWRAAGIPVAVVGAVLLQTDIDLTVTFEAGFDTSGSREIVAQAVADAVNVRKIGDTLHLATIVAAALNSGAENILNAVVNDPAGDLQPAANELIQTERSRVSFS